MLQSEAREALGGFGSFSRFYVNPPGSQPSRTSNKRKGNWQFWQNLKIFAACGAWSLRRSWRAAARQHRKVFDRGGAAAERAFLVILSPILTKSRACSALKRLNYRAESRPQTHPDRTPPSPLLPRAHPECGSCQQRPTMHLTRPTRGQLQRAENPDF